MIPNTGFNPAAYAAYGGGAGSGAGVRAFYHPPPVFYFYPSPPVSPTAPPHLYQPQTHLVNNTKLILYIYYIYMLYINVYILKTHVCTFCMFVCLLCESTVSNWPILLMVL